MTGFGKASISNDQFNASIEIKTINSRYRDFIIKLPNSLNIIDSNIRELLGEKIIRGKVEVIINYSNKNGENNQIEINDSLAHSLSKTLDKLLKYNTLIEPSIDLSLFTSFPGILQVKETDFDKEDIWNQIQPVVQSALNECIEAREIEGRRLLEDIKKHLENSQQILTKIKELAPIQFKLTQKKLHRRLENYLNGVELDENKFLNEVAILADKLAIDEEITRLEIHLQRLEELINEDGPIGRKIDFLIQELNREANTIGSKTDSTDIINCVVDLKSEIEKMREQVQNVE